MNRGSAAIPLIVAVVVILIGGMGYWAWTQKSGLPAITPETESQTTQQNTNLAGLYKFHTEHIYRNDKLGFQVEIPPTWTKYAVRENTDETGTVIYFALPLAGNILPDILGEPESSSRVINIQWLDVMPVAYFEAHKNDCESADGPCAFPTEITRNSMSVYAWGWPNPHAGWDYCGDAAGTEPYVCRVHGDYWVNDQSIFEKTLKLIP